jgi:hypothetical protein
MPLTYATFEGHLAGCEQCKAAVREAHAHRGDADWLCDKGLALARVTSEERQRQARDAILQLGVPLDLGLDVYGDDLGAMPELWRMAHRVAAAQARRMARSFEGEAEGPELHASYKRLMRERAMALHEMAAEMDREAEA